MNDLNGLQALDNRELSLKLLVVLSKAYKVVMDRAMRDMKKYGLSATEFTVLELLYHKGRIPLQQIGDKILVTSGSITYNIDKLEKKGYLNRVPCSEDRRVTYAVIADKGTDLFHTIFPDHANVIESIMQGLAPEEKRDAIELLKKLGLEAQKIE
ncbi:MULTISPECIES: MarR family transcriptional regulator [unclassified Paenibacillus]|uniref:MarR family winged helix-turn-helix transcriptional regulator n=1 Tax=unclassified Paenibacillus TaxID=185978 RepID=UPI001AE1B1B6|nr:MULTISPECIES: MarR family transcriptional regulator [unclassified Paenibacillus]MBP1157226.1 MarR family 2-MHQ and catechol resistance regulon transcriptional repressor [Paenibacillus sp. PvP091]MBP1172035.1 MarR family 2-MHQ and catechol resistance regulon transcriptional repressor [Paenibacillus sp. PvR098]MBP2438416.1 MarR family 2-MHQ and catechol resistance regulon transcriptional repressor [Paenibacillus sp. PvP052]